MKTKELLDELFKLEGWVKDMASVKNNPCDGNKPDYFKCGRQEAYSATWFRLKPIIDGARWLHGDRFIYRILIPIGTFLLGSAITQWFYL